MIDQQQWEELGQQLRVDSVRAAAAPKSGHPTSSMSAADLVAVLASKYLHYDFSDPANPNNDHLIFSKGHASPLLYSLYKAVGVASDDDLLSFRTFGSRYEGHPTPILPWVDVATGSLGQGLPIGVGVALAGKRLDRLPYRVWVLCGDSEMAEGSMWEAFEHAAHAGLDNLTAIIDVNRLGQRGETMHGWDLDSYLDRARAFGWHAIGIDGHDVAAIDAAYAEAVSTTGKPTVIVARTKKGRGVKAVEDQDDAHGKPVADRDDAIAELGGERDLTIEVPKPESGDTPHTFETGELELPSYELGESVATRKAYGEALAALGTARADVVALDGEVSNSTYAEIFKDAHPERFFEMYIAEQQMVAAAIGMQVRGWVPFASSFAAFLSRAYDFVRMAAVSQATFCLVGSHVGVSIGEDGPSQMGLEDLAAFRAVYGSTLLYPCDANQTAQLVRLMADQKGISYLRTTRGNTPVIYGPDEEFSVGGSKVVRSSDDDQVVIVSAGITLHEALEAAETLAGEGIAARVVDCYSVKPIDAAGLREAARAAGNKVITVEDHWPEGGLGDAVLDAFADSDHHTRIV
ncbi:MAG TPA: transketolase, partial [Acidimicrobiales bacterium]|nr:transketolase [Acidimicrobiales bacterium]